MVWPFTPSSDDAHHPPPQQDPLQNLDPSLRSFLERESPLKYDTPAAPAPPQQRPPPPSQRQPPTLFKDGRYAHLWETYKPLGEVEAESSSPSEKLSDVLAAYRDRKASIAQAALENCADEQWDLDNCYRSGAWGDRLFSCTRFVRRLDRCYAVNQRLLRALGYLSAWDRPPEIEERIQMHADKLYQNMLAHERDEAEAAERGEAREARQVPASDERKEGDMGLPAIVEELRPRIRERFADKLAKIKPEERALEERALAMEMIAGKDVARRVLDLQQERLDEKAERSKQGKATVSDRVSSLLGW